MQRKPLDLKWGCFSYSRSMCLKLLALYGSGTHMHVCLDATEYRGKRQVARDRRLKTMEVVDTHKTMFSKLFSYV